MSFEGTMTTRSFWDKKKIKIIMAKKKTPKERKKARSLYINIVSGMLLSA